MVRLERFELPTYCSGGNRSIHLSYRRTPVASVYMQGWEASTRCTDKLWTLIATPSSATTTAASAVAAAITASAAAVASTAASVLGFWTCLIYVKSAPAYLRSVQCSNGFFSVFVAGHFHKAEAARASGVAVRHNADPVHLPERFKHLPEFVFRCVEAQISNKNILQASSSALSCRSASSKADWQVGDTFLEIETGASEQSNAARSIAGLSS
jgi:hypothetical protein